MKNKKALIFYISRYSGHYHAAAAIAEGLKEVSPGIEVKNVNAFSYTNPILEKIITKTYLEVIKKNPEFWGRIYDNPDVMKNIVKVRNVIHSFNNAKIFRLMQKERPDIIYCTQAFPCGMVANYKRLHGGKEYLVGVLTDNAPHSYWLFDEVDCYIVPSSEAKDVLVKKGVPDEKIKVYGIPVSLKFRKKNDPREIKAMLGFNPDVPVVLIMGGSQGLGAIDRMVMSLLEDKDHLYQLLVVTGANRKLFSRLEKLPELCGASNIRIFSYIDNIEEMMDASDVIVTKAGGLTTAEALVKGLPLILVDPIPGHERMNADYLIKSGAALEIADFGELHKKIKELEKTKAPLIDIKRNIEKIAKPNSTVDAARLVLGL